MKRRSFITLLGSAAAWPLSARAQHQQRLRRVGVLMGIADDAEGRLRAEAFRDGMRDLGWIEGRNVLFEYRWTEGHTEQIRAAAAELVAMQPDVLVSNSAPSAVALRNQTRAIPVVFVLASDPVGMGLVASLARPGGNITGLSQMSPELMGKRLELLKEMVPSASGSPSS